MTPDQINQRLVAHLGDPVPVSPALGDKYSDQALITFITEAIKGAGHRAAHLMVDNSEAPPLVAGLVEGVFDFPALRAAIEAVGDGRYIYGGCSSDRKVGVFRFAVNLVPMDVLGDHADRASRRLVLRLDLLRDELAR